MLVSVAIVFPVVFSIGSAYTRRETARSGFPISKVMQSQFIMLSRDWSADKNELAAQARELLHEMLVTMKDMFKTKTSTEWRNMKKEDL